MKISEFLTDQVFRPRVKSQSVLVVYDPQRRYRKSCQALRSDVCRFVDASDSSILSREDALAALQELGRADTTIHQLVVYVPTEPPITDEEKQRDPFAIYGQIGNIFPSGDGDAFQSICLKAKADQTTQIRQIFAENPSPSFEVIDAIGGAGGWPQLQACLGVDSARDLLYALLAPTESQKAKLKETENWVAETKELLKGSLGLKLLTRGKTWNSIGDELWRYVLFSEFVFDLPESLPVELSEVPCAPKEARPLIDDLCERLRNDRRSQAIYIERAEAIELELKLVTVCKQVGDLGIRDTFPFEERSFFAKAVAALESDSVDEVRQILDRHSGSVWVGKGESQAQWQLLRSASNLIEACDDAGRQLPDHSRDQKSLIDYYISSLREVDRLQREFEQAISDSMNAGDMLEKVVHSGRAVYRKMMERLQGLFVGHLESTGWPAADRMTNTEVFDKLVAPKLTESGRRVAYVLVDALRYELGVALESQLREDGQSEIQAVCAQLPTVTPIGMASLLPGAATGLAISRVKDQAMPTMDGLQLKNVTHRMKVLEQRYGNRFAHVKMTEILKPRHKVDKSIELLVVRTNAIDEMLESNPEIALEVIGGQLKRLRTVVHKLREYGFDDAIIATDHGFVLNSHAEPGDVGSKPAGTWITLHDRSLLGDGAGDANNFVIPCEHAGIRGDFAQLAGPKALVAYSNGVNYFHGGASLQESIVPVISVRLRTADDAKKDDSFTVKLLYKSKKITTRLPVLDVVVESEGMLDFMDSDVEILLEAYDPDGKLVGEAKRGGPVDATTGTVTIKRGATEKVTIRMELEYEGKFTLKAVDPVTMNLFAKLNLETDYMI